MTSRQLAVQKIADWKTNVNQFAYDNFKITPDKWQEKVLNAVPSKDPDKQRIAMGACVGPGKTCVQAIIGLWFLSCNGDKFDKPKGASVAITKDNLKDNLWPEYAKLLKRSEWLNRQFTWTKSLVYNNAQPEDWFLSARSFAKTADPEEQGRTLSGLHSRYVLAQLDESGDIPPAVGNAAEQIMSQGNAEFCKIIQSGNPTSRSGILYEAWMERTTGRWFYVRITSDPEDSDRSPRIDRDWETD